MLTNQRVYPIESYHIPNQKEFSWIFLNFPIEIFICLGILRQIWAVVEVWWPSSQATCYDSFKGGWRP